jgi:hypothetical protein
MRNVFSFGTVAVPVLTLFLASTGVNAAEEPLSQRDEVPGQEQLLQVKKVIPTNGSVQVFSAKNRQGLDELIKHLAAWYGMTSRTKR